MTASADIENILPQIATIEREIINPVIGSGIYVYDDIPYSINTANMPLFINFPGNLVESVVIARNRTARVFKETRDYGLSFFLAGYAQGVEGEKWHKLQPYFKLVYAKFGGYPTLKNLGGVFDARLTADTGMNQLLEFIGQNWFGCKFTLRVVSQVVRTLGDNE